MCNFLFANVVRKMGSDEEFFEVNEKNSSAKDQVLALEPMESNWQRTTLLIGILGVASVNF